MDNETTETSGVDSTQRNITIPILVIFAVPAYICFLFIFYNAIQLRRQLIFNTIHNHIIFLLLLVDFLSIATEMPITLYYLTYGNVHTVKICTFWIYWNYTLPVTSLFLTTYASIERYFLVFHRHTVQKHKYLFHYIPMLLFTIYIPILYFGLIVFIPCPDGSSYDITEITCDGACYTDYLSLNTFDTIWNQSLPCVVILIFNGLIIIRVIMSRTTVLRSASIRGILKKNRRLIVQLLGVSSMSLIAWLPWLIINIQDYFYVPLFGYWFMIYALPFLPYITASMSPFFALIGLPEIRRKIKIGRLETQITPFTL